ncbi:CLUMA_CG015315, isoform B [Clunio marinus]|uniref:choline-phosphate cytidylyltransferase n=1 Tax=Clunio marinus TaxID=568069 RepID=A0A1J1IS80_9DIPT|nr:CLUMA_CG015315, isoform B [Clunio marinus]
MTSRKRSHEASKTETPNNGLSSSLEEVNVVINGSNSSIDHSYQDNDTKSDQYYIRYPINRPTICKPAPYSTDPEAIAEREACDYSQRINVDMARNGNCPRKVRVYTDGIYDLFHQGHARQMMQAKNVFPNSQVYLIIGCCSDELTHSLKGRTVMTDVERYEAIRHCRYVDEIIRDAPWKISDEFMEKYKIDFVAQDSTPYVSNGCDDVYKEIKEKGCFVATERTEGVSTSGIVARIVKDYDLYVRRNLQRGYTAKELNVSFLNEKKFRLQNKIDEMKHKGKKVIDDVKGDFIQKWEEKSNEFIRTFLMLFGRDNLSQIWDKSKGRIKDALHPRSPTRGMSPSLSEEDHYDNQRDQRHDSPPAKRAHHLSLTSDDDEDEEFLSPTATTFPSLGFTRSIRDGH